MHLIKLQKLRVHSKDINMLIWYCYVKEQDIKWIYMQYEFKHAHTETQTYQTTSKYMKIWADF